MIGPDYLLERMGVAGIGEVRLAEQKKPLPRRVAVKSIKAGIDSGEVIRGLNRSARRWRWTIPPLRKDAGSTQRGPVLCDGVCRRISDHRPLPRAPAEHAGASGIIHSGV